jgi:transglutaminase-like putative cysteine protease
LIRWIKDNIRREAVDVFSALDVLEHREAECQGHSYLYAAFARALKIPTRIVNGIVYSKQHQGFLYHTWAESYQDHRWIAVDPTFHQLPADATHIKFVEGERISDLLPLVDLIGKIKVRIVSYEYTDKSSFSKHINRLRLPTIDDRVLTERQ